MPVLPITFIGNIKLIPDQGVFEIRPGKVIQYVLTPIQTKGLELKDVKFLKNKVQMIISNKLKESSKWDLQKALILFFTILLSW